MSKLVKILISIVSIILILVISVVLIYKYEIGAVSKESYNIEFEIPENSTYLSIAGKLKENGLIKSELFYKIYIKINKPEKLEKGRYNLNKNMDVENIVNVLSKGSNYNPDVITLTFKEGINMNEIVKVIENNTNNTSKDVLDLLENKEYLDELINKYWFINDEIKDGRIYFSLEGYLYPDTYQYNKDATVKDIFAKMLDKMDEVLSQYKDDIKNSTYSVHQLLTLSSIIELEAAASDDRAGVAGVFYNRLNNNWSLGSDVTTYYASGVNMSERDLYQEEIDAVNDYNTRSVTMAGKLPIGPICIPSKESIEATISPSKHDYFFFVADKYKKTYFTKTYSEHNKIKAKLKEEGLWFEYKK